MLERKFLLRKTPVRIIAGLLAVLWMFTIFSYSSQDAEESSQVSVSTGYMLVSAVDRILNLNLGEEKIQDTAYAIEKIVRKAAHVTEYAILGTLWGIAIDAWGYESIVRKIISILICSIYAATDEYHQTFVDGRSGSVRDVLIDTFGALMMVVIITIIVKRIRERRKK